MEEKGREIITAFDTVLTTNRIQMMKVFLSYLAPELQSGLAVYIKFSELQYVMQLARQFPRRPVLQNRRTVLSFKSLMDGSLFVKDQAGVLELLDELLPFSAPSERKRILDLKNMLVSMSRMREMMEMMEMMKELFPEGMGESGGGFGDMFSAMGGMGGEGMGDLAGMAGMSNMFPGMDPSALVQLMQMFQTSSGSGSGDGGDNSDQSSHVEHSVSDDRGVDGEEIS